MSGPIVTPRTSSAPRGRRLGWIVQRHGELYEREYGWGVAFEALVAGVVADFADQRAERPERVAGWIAELGGERAGSVLCMRDDDETARLRLLLVEPFARGHGIGPRPGRGMHPLRPARRLPGSASSGRTSR